MNKTFYSLGLMSGTSGDGVDASIISSDGHDEYEEIKMSILDMTIESSKISIF